MGAFVSSKPVRISLPDAPDEWIEIKAKLSLGDREALEAGMFDIRMNGNTAQFDIRGDKLLSSYAGQILLKAVIVAWNLADPDDETKIMPLADESFARIDLDSPIITEVLQEVDRRNPFFRARRVKVGSPS
jgi:hypothetical protein